MSQETLIAASVIAVLVVMVVIKTWLHSLVTFKMDESVIVRQLQAGGSQRFGAAAIAQGTGLDSARVVIVCNRSKAIESDSDATEFWCE